jgi:hypothetical protein
MSRYILGSLLLFANLVSAAQATSNAQTDFQDPAAAAKKVPVIDGAVGPCSLELAVNSVDSKPVYAAVVKVHIAYGFGGMRKLDLEASTNIDGKVKFVGIPSRVRRPPLQFRAAKDQFAGTGDYDPTSECQAKQVIVLRKADSQENK